MALVANSAVWVADAGNAVVLAREENVKWDKAVKDTRARMESAVTSVIKNDRSRIRERSFFLYLTLERGMPLVRGLASANPVGDFVKSGASSRTIQQNRSWSFSSKKISVPHTRWLPNGFLPNLFCVDLAFCLCDKICEW